MRGQGVGEIGGESVRFRVKVGGGEERVAVGSAWASCKKERNRSQGEGDEGKEREGLGWAWGGKEQQLGRAGRWRGVKGVGKIRGGSLGFRVRIVGGEEGAVMRRVGRVREQGNRSRGEGDSDEEVEALGPIREGSERDSRRGGRRQGAKGLGRSEEAVLDLD